MFLRLVIILIFTNYISLAYNDNRLRAYDNYYFDIISPNENIIEEIEEKINQFISKHNGKYHIYKHNNNLGLYLKLKITSQSYNEIRTSLKDFYPNINFVLKKFLPYRFFLSNDPQYLSFIGIKMLYKDQNILDFFAAKQDLISIFKHIYNHKNKEHDYIIKIKKLKNDNLLDKELEYCEKISNIMISFEKTIKNAYVYYGKNVFETYNSMISKMNNISHIQKKDIMFLKKSLLKYNYNYINLITFLYRDKKNIKNSHIRSWRKIIIEKKDNELIKEELTNILNNIIINAKNHSYKEVETSLNTFYELLVSSQLLTDKWDDIFYTSPKRYCYGFNTEFIKNILQKKLNVIVSDKLTIEDNNKNMIILLTKTGSPHTAPLIRIVNKNNIYWVLMETIAESDLWFLNSNFEKFFINFKKIVEEDKIKNPHKNIKAYLNRIKLQKSPSLCETFAYANSCEIFKNLDEFINFLDNYIGEEKNNTIYIESLPYFLTKYAQGISNLESITYANQYEIALEKMFLLKDNGENTQKNAAIFLVLYSLFKEVIKQVLVNNAEHYTDAMLYYEEDNLNF